MSQLKIIPLQSEAPAEKPRAFLDFLIRDIAKRTGISEAMLRTPDDRGYRPIPRLVKELLP